MITGETILSGAPDTCEDCDERLELRVCRSAAGHYIGTMCSCGPYSRESEYFNNHKEAQFALDSGTWTPR